MATQDLPLAGVRIVDLSQIAAGPFATSLLGDFGADVIKVEPPDGDPLRQVDEAFGPGESAYSFAVNRSKRSIRLDLKTADGKAVLLRLLKTADVLVTSMRPAAVRRLGLDHASLADSFPGLVVCSITGWGGDGPLADRPGMDILAQARGGTMGTTGEPGRSPVKVAPAVADFVGSFLACNAILLGLRVRDRDGVGQEVSVNLLDGQVALLSNLSVAYHRTGTPFAPQGGATSNIVPYQVFETGDGWIVVACLTEKFWEALCRALERPDLFDDPRYRTNAQRVAHREELIFDLSATFRAQATGHWQALLDAEDVPCSPVNRLHEVFTDPQVVHNQMSLVLSHPRHGDIVTVNNPIRMHDTPARPWGYPPGAGEHTDAVLGELGYTPDEIGRLRDGGAAL
ncbi:CaiB/BaiF CoA-transferase family protein [Arthrobacter sp. 18067]|uniref:CaiB/BaiF CoA transferase family protein n=1 Tax=Arthrobacter sp. 18067 TaxID=2681413 RepID=UPI00135B8CB0|nr:CoA transferase [Arthrobacter sp. 18067]